MTSLTKINSDGKYTNFPGVTVIARINHQQLDLWRQVHACISQCDLATCCYAPLPVESYHMTAVNLYSESQIEENTQKMSWETYLTQELPFFTQLAVYCKNHAFTPKIVIEDIEVSYSIQLILSLSLEHKRLINEFAGKFNIIGGIPDKFHMTLGYQYQSNGLTAKQDIRKHLLERLKHVFAAAVTEPFALEAPTLCWFKTMEAFEPWDGTSYPFTSDDSAVPISRFSR